MPDHYNGNYSAENRAQQQLRDLGRTVRQTAKDLDTSYPNAAESSRILRQYQQQVARTLQPPPAPQRPPISQPQKKRKWSWLNLLRLPQGSPRLPRPSKYDLRLVECSLPHDVDAPRKKRRN